jgi:hypothetical protein
MEGWGGEGGGDVAEGVGAFVGEAVGAELGGIGRGPDADGIKEEEEDAAGGQGSGWEKNCGWRFARRGLLVRTGAAFANTLFRL